MKDKILIAEDCIKNEIGYMDLCVQIKDGKLIVTAEDHDGYKWEAECDVEKIFN
jgi:hypothetical protein